MTILNPEFAREGVSEVHNAEDSDHVVACDACWKVAGIEYRANEHRVGDHADFMDMDCPLCVEEAKVLGVTR